MISPKYILLLVVCCMALLWACKPSVAPDKVAADIIQALESENIEAARSRADAFFASEVALDTVAVPRLCQLAVTLARLSDANVEHSDDYMARALQCYRVAISKDSVTAFGYFEALGSDDYQYAKYLSQLRRQIDVRERGIIVDESDSNTYEEQ